MKRSKELALLLAKNSEEKLCNCGGDHEICLNCRVCRADGEDMLATDLENLAQYIDHTALKPETTSQQIVTLCAEAEKFQTKSVCVNPIYVSQATKELNKVITCTVVGFPLSNSLTATIVQETKSAIKQGATEIDMVIKANWLKDKQYELILDEISQISTACSEGGAILKVIFENCLLNDDEIIIASLLSKKAGSEFIKTSTGFNSGGATIENVELMRNTVGPKLGVKAAGGIRDRKTTLAMLKAGANRIGASRTLDIIKG